MNNSKMMAESEENGQGASLGRYHTQKMFVARVSAVALKCLQGTLRCTTLHAFVACAKPMAGFSILKKYCTSFLSRKMFLLKENIDGTFCTALLHWTRDARDCGMEMLLMHREHFVFRFVEVTQKAAASISFPVRSLTRPESPHSRELETPQETSFRDSHNLFIVDI